MKVFVVLLVWALQPSTNATKNILEVAWVLDPPLGLSYSEICAFILFFIFFIFYLFNVDIKTEYIFRIYQKNS